MNEKTNDKSRRSPYSRASSAGRASSGSRSTSAVRAPRRRPVSAATVSYLLSLFTGAVLAGMSIGLGGLVFLAVEDKVLGAALFTIGLFSVCSFGMNLYTGKICYLLQNGTRYAKGLPVIWLGNLAGTGLTALFASLTRSGAALSEKAAALCQIKLEDSLVSLFFLGVLCNIFIFIAVEGYRSIPHAAGKYLAILFGVMVFILCGTEHCVADMFYFWIGRAWSLKAVLCILVITLGNSIGGMLFPLLMSIQNPS